MAKSLNSVQIIGNLGADPETSTLPNNDLVATFSIATTEKWMDKSTNEERERTDWHRITAFRGNAEVVKNFLRKGSQVFIQGAIRYDSWEDKDTGETKYATKIIANNIILLGKAPLPPVAGNHPEAAANSKPATASMPSASEPQAQVSTGVTKRPTTDNDEPAF